MTHAPEAARPTQKPLTQSVSICRNLTRESCILEERRSSTELGLNTTRLVWANPFRCRSQFVQFFSFPQHVFMSINLTAQMKDGLVTEND